jgi:DNA ligase (NAD+)
MIRPWGGEFFKKQCKIYDFLQKLRFPSQIFYHICEKIYSAAEISQRLNGERDQLPYAADDMLFKANDRVLQEQLGATAKEPREAFAYKSEPERAETILQNVTFQIGRTGIVTPVAELEAVKLSPS